MTPFGTALRRARRERDQSQAFLAKALGTTTTSVCRIERGTYVKLSDEQLATLRAMYGDLPPYFADPEEIRRGLMAEMRALTGARALVVSSRKVRRYQAALAAVALGEAYIVKDETVYPTRGPEPDGGGRIPHRRLMLRAALVEEDVI